MRAPGREGSVTKRDRLSAPELLFITIDRSEQLIQQPIAARAGFRLLEKIVNTHESLFIALKCGDLAQSQTFGSFLFVHWTIPVHTSIFYGRNSYTYECIIDTN
uniref:Uncharacterized protein n=1 Tax=Magnetococcus massalia (strain MO-1) TaxID=451514 RepID=A0A1S7LM27_MAGMO|nr:Protein of unknown function [Candidatus Magnetococcus massalia]